MNYVITGIKPVTRGNYDIIDIKVNDPKYAGKWISGFAGDINKVWKIGQTVGIEIFTKEKDDKIYLNYKLDKEQPAPDAKPPKTPYEEGIEERHEDRLDGMALGNAKNCATQIVCKLIEKGLCGTTDLAEEYLTKFTSFIYNLKPYNKETGEEGNIPFE